ncbi:MAG TPA: disulfide oxidoreductase [Patescibacteria group bacterium]
MKDRIFLYGAWCVAIIAMLGSLFFSEVMHLPPCILCWYQRICMYPLVLILGVGIYTRDKHIVSYVLPLSILGMGIALYHNLLYYGFIPESLAPCRAGISCTTKLIEWWGFVTIPFLSFVAFGLITTAMFLVLKQSKGNNHA